MAFLLMGFPGVIWPYFYMERLRMIFHNEVKNKTERKADKQTQRRVKEDDAR